MFHLWQSSASSFAALIQAREVVNPIGNFSRDLDGAVCCGETLIAHILEALANLRSIRKHFFFALQTHCCWVALTSSLSLHPSARTVLTCVRYAAAPLPVRCAYVGNRLAAPRTSTRPVMPVSSDPSAFRMR